LIEVLVATTLTLVLIGALVRVFEMVSTGVNDARSTLEMNDRLRERGKVAQSFLRTGRKGPIEPVELGHSTASLCIPGNIAQILKRKFTWDPAREQSTDEEVNRMLRRPMRAPWRL
jgi:hypothetical protein